MPVYALGGKIPRIATSAFVHPEAVIIGDVAIGDNCFIAPGAVIRGDLGPVTLAEGVSFQDNAVIHVDHGGEVVLENDVIIGHGAILHDVHIYPRAIVGMGAVVMFRVVCEEDSFVAAGAVVMQGMRVPAGTIVGGNPAKIIKKAPERLIRETAEGASLYRELVSSYKKEMKRIS